MTEAQTSLEAQASAAPASSTSSSVVASPLTGNPATDYAVALLTGLVARGLRHLVLSPGSRSQALALVAAELERLGAIELHVRIDERVGGFLALGIGLESGTPAAVVTTSGTATANLHPAVLEARASRVPMIVITADRPSELRGIRANQTTMQPGLYGTATAFARDEHATADAVAGAGELAGELWAAAFAGGPAHLNLALRDPLSVAVPDLTNALDAARASAAGASGTASSGAASQRSATGPERVVGASRRTVVIAGNAAGPAAESIARLGGWPLLAEASSGARFGPNLIVAYRELLADADFGGRVERAIVFGHPTLSREIPQLLARAEVETIVVDPSAGEHYDPGHHAVRVGSLAIGEDVDPASATAREWTGRWVLASRRMLEEQAAQAASADQKAPGLEAGRSRDAAVQAAFARDELAAVRAPVTRRMLADALWRFTWPHDRLVLGASRLIRELDRTVTGKKITVHANRGLAGIDGTVSTALGIALAHTDPAQPERAAGVTRVLLGDLTLLHDAGALLTAAGERMPAVQVIVGNDGGGTIFAGLEVGRTASPHAFERVQLTPRTVDFAALATAYGWRYIRASTRGELDQALSAPTAQPTLIEVPLS